MSDHYFNHLFVKFSFGFLVSVVLLSVNNSAEARLYKWIDENGQIRYGDQLPPEYANKKHFQLDQEGRVIMTKKAGKSPEQLKKEREQAKKDAEQKEKEKAEAEEQRILQQRQDRILLLTFNSEEDIFYSRDQRLQVLDTKISLLKKNKESSKEKLLVLQQQANDQYTSKKLEVPGGLQQKIEQMNRKIQTADKNIQLSNFKREDVLNGFEKDLARFRDLKARQRKNKHEDN